MQTLSPLQLRGQAGFAYHHAEADYVMLTSWLPTNSPSTLPSNASHQVGIGAFVLNDRREVLAVQERSGPLKGRGVWKFPTGIVNQAEDIAAGAVREVLEETGVQTEFVQVLSFRHGHNFAFGKSDLFFVCILRPLSWQIRIQESEIEDAQWMPFDDFARQPFYQESKLFATIIEVCKSHLEGEHMGFSPVQFPGRGPLPSSLFLPISRENPRM